MLTHQKNELLQEVKQLLKVFHRFQKHQVFGDNYFVIKNFMQTTIEIITADATSLNLRSDSLTNFKKLVLLLDHMRNAYEQLLGRSSFWQSDEPFITKQVVDNRTRIKSLQEEKTEILLKISETQTAIQRLSRDLQLSSLSNTAIPPPKLPPSPFLSSSTSTAPVPQGEYAKFDLSFNAAIEHSVVVHSLEKQNVALFDSLLDQIFSDQQADILPLPIPILTTTPSGFDLVEQLERAKAEEAARQAAQAKPKVILDDELISLRDRRMEVWTELQTQRKEQQLERQSFEAQLSAQVEKYSILDKMITSKLEAQMQQLASLIAEKSKSS